MNQITLTGRVVKDATARLMTNGSSVVTFDFAVKRTTTSPNYPDTDFFRCTAFGKTAESMSKCLITKGTKLLLSGELRNDTYIDKTGQKVTHAQVVVYRFEFLESKKASVEQEQVAVNDPANVDYSEEDEMEVPFI